MSKRLTLVVTVVLAVVAARPALAGTVLMDKAQAAYLVAHALTETVPDYDSTNWPDVPPGSFCADEIMFCADNGIIYGTPEGLYRPYHSVTRAMMAEYAARTVNFSDHDLGTYNPPVTASFSDVPDTHEAYLYVEYLLSKGVISVPGDGLFHPDDPMDMYEAAGWLETITGRYVDPATVPGRTGFVAGTVTDAATGAPVEGAMIYCLLLTDLGSEISNTGDPSGPDGSYNIEVAVMDYDRFEAVADGYYSMIEPGATVASGATVEIDWELDRVPTDVPADSWAFEAIAACVQADIVSGYEDGTYQPGNPVTRDQMAVYISRAVAGGDENVPEFTETPTFPDVPEGFWALDYVEYAVSQNVVGGYQDGTYHPEYEVTRDQMAVYVARALVAPEGEAGLADYVPADPRDFPDVASDFWSYTHIEYCVENGVVAGYLDGLYHPEIVVTRDQMAVYVARAFGLPS
jgi:hypothetical protein